VTILKYSAPDWCFFEDRGYHPDVYYRRLKELGCGGVEMLDPERWQAARAAELDIVNMGAYGITEQLNRRANHEELVAEIREKIRVAAENGIGQVIVFSGNAEGQPAEEGLDNCIEALREVAPDAEAAGVKVAFEMLNSYDHQDYQADFPGYGLELARAVASPAVGVLYDVYHMYRMGRGETAILDDLLDNLDIVLHVHVAGAPGRGFPGADQEIDYSTIIENLAGAGYDRFIGFEFIPQAEPLDELTRAVELFEAHARGDRAGG